MDCYLVLVNLKRKESIIDEMGITTSLNLSNVMKVQTYDGYEDPNKTGISIDNLGSPNFLDNDKHSLNNYAGQLTGIVKEKRYRLFIKPDLPKVIVKRYENNDDQTNFPSIRLPILMSIVDYEFKKNYRNNYESLTNDNTVIISTGNIKSLYDREIIDGNFLEPIHQVIKKFINTLKYIAENKNELSGKQIKFIYVIEYADENISSTDIAYSYDKLIQELKEILNSNNEEDYNLNYTEIKNQNDKKINIRSLIESVIKYVENNRSITNIIQSILENLKNGINEEVIPNDIKNNLEIVRAKTFCDVTKAVWNIGIISGKMEIGLTQNNKDDSMSNKNKNYGDLSEKEISISNSFREPQVSINSLLEIAELYKETPIELYKIIVTGLDNDGRWKEAINNINKVIEQSSDPLAIMEFRFFLGKIQHQKGEDEKALKTLENLQEELNQKTNLEKNNKQRNIYELLSIESLYIFGEIYRVKNDMTKAERYFKLGYKISKKLDDKKLIAIGEDNIGLIYRKKNDFDGAIQRHLNSMRLKKELEIDDTEKDKLISYSLTNIAVCHEIRSDYDEAKKFYKQAIELKNRCGDRRGLVMCKGSLGQIEGMLTNFEDGLKLQMESLRINKEMGDQRGIAISYYNMGYIYLYQNLPQKAVENFEEAIEEKEKKEYDCSREYPLATYCYCKLNEWENAFNKLKYLKENGIKDETYSMEMVSVGMMLAVDNKYNKNIKKYYDLSDNSEEYFKKAIEQSNKKEYARGSFLALFEYGLYLKNHTDRIDEARLKFKSAKKFAQFKNMKAFLQLVEQYDNN